MIYRICITLFILVTVLLENTSLIIISPVTSVTEVLSLSALGKKSYVTSLGLPSKTEEKLTKLIFE